MVSTEQCSWYHLLPSTIDLPSSTFKAMGVEGSFALKSISSSYLKNKYGFFSCQMEASPAEKEKEHNAAHFHGIENRRF
jgi:hypothetical protein